jgi:hypothetical protein
MQLRSSQRFSAAVPHISRPPAVVVRDVEVNPP